MSTRLSIPKYLRRKTAPTTGGGRGSKLSDYGKQLREKQKVRFAYGIREKQFRTYFELASRSQSATGATLLINLERRLDNIIYRLNFATSRAQARQMVNHGHVKVNGSRVNIPSYLVKVGDSIELAGMDPIARDADVATWLKISDKKLPVGVVERLPERADLDPDINEELIVEFYSR